MNPFEKLAAEVPPQEEHKEPRQEAIRDGRRLGEIRQNSEFVFGVHKEDTGAPITKDEYKRLRAEFDQKITTKAKKKLGLWSDFEERRKFDEFLIEQGYIIERRGRHAA